MTDIFITEFAEGPFTVHDGKREWRFEFSDRFGPVVLRKDGEPAARQPGENSPFWSAFEFWNHERLMRPLRQALIDARTWHQMKDKALSKSGRGDAAYYWERSEHQGQIAEINAVLGDV